MSDEKSDAISERERGYLFALAALQTPASREPVATRSVRFMESLIRTVLLFFMLALYAIVALNLWIAWHDGQWRFFWITVTAALLVSLALSWLLGRLDAEKRQILWFHKGIEALRQAATSEDNRLAPVREIPTLLREGELASSAASIDSLEVGPLRRLYISPAESMYGCVGLVLLWAGPYSLVQASELGIILSDALSYVYIAAAAFIFVCGILFLFIFFQLLRSFTISATEQGFDWQQTAFRIWRRNAKASWQDVRAFVMFRMRRDGKSAEIGATTPLEDEIFLLDTTNEALAWRITPKTPASVREAHERFVHMANEHVPLRDITASLKNLLESPETRSYEYAVTALSGPAPVPPAVRNVLTTPVRESHFLRGYLIVAAILLALLVAAGLLLQYGVISASAF